MSEDQPNEAPRPGTGAIDRKTALEDARTVVVKVGTNVVARPTGETSLGRVHSIVEELVDLHRDGRKVILVTSAAISMGMNRLRFQESPKLLRDKQACASVGQIRLMSVYQQAFDSFGIACGQILLTEEDFSSRPRYLNLRNTMSRLLELGVLPIVNENDSISTSEIEEEPAPGRERESVFGDNDMLSALVASKLGADVLLILSDVDGLYPLAPARAKTGSAGRTGDREQTPISIVRRITPEIEAIAGVASGRGRGGMTSKLRAVRVAVQSGTPVVIASGIRGGTISRVLAGEDVGTLFLPARRLGSRKRWIAFASAPTGRVRVNPGARDALVARRSSLLFAGVIAVEGNFRRGDVVSIVDNENGEFARGITNFDEEQAQPLVGKRSAEISEVVGHNFAELITRDNIVIIV